LAGRVARFLEAPKQQTTMTVSISISDAYDGGNGVLVETRENPSDPDVLEVFIDIKPDVYTELEDIQHMQWWSFRVFVSGIEGGVQRIKYVLRNAEDVSYPEAWTGTTVCYADDVRDVDSWRRVHDTFYTQGQLWWEFLHAKNGSLFFSYFPPYSYERHLSLISKCVPYANVETLGQTLEGREIECITTGTGSLACWIIHRQHPGETMASSYAEGLLNRLCLGPKSNGEIDEKAKEALKVFTFYIVPCMCPDGVVKGHLRTNSVGANLNREWANKGEYKAPTLQRSPEVYYVLEKMKETGVDCFLDIHGDEELPFNFLSGASHVPHWGPRLEALHGAFAAAYTRANSDMQQKIGYPPPESPEQVSKYMNVATNSVCHRFDCFAATLVSWKDKVVSACSYVVSHHGVLFCFLDRRCHLKII
jgi:murein tripeptide amidase MpaA